MSEHKTHEQLLLEQENVLRLSKSGCSLKVGWDEKRIVASLPHNDPKNCNQQWLDDAERLCDGWNELPKAKEETTRLRKQLEIAVGALGGIQQRLAGNQYAFTSYNLAVQALAAIRELEK